MNNCKNQYKLMRNFYNLGINEVRIVDYLMQKDVAELTYCELTEELGMDKKMESNIRKAVIHLQELEIVCIVNKYMDKDKRVNPMKACFLLDNWTDNLLRMEIDGKNNFKKS